MNYIKTFGVALPDAVIKSNRKTKTFKASNLSLTPATQSPSQQAPPSWRISFFQLGLCTLLLLILVRAFVLQIVKGDYYNAMSDGNRIIKRPLTAPRGIIVDRNNIVLTRNTPLYVNKDQQLITHKEYLQLTSEKQKEYALSPIRDYVCGEECAHVIGYIGKISQEEYDQARKLKSQNTNIYTTNDYIGKAGLENYYEAALKGKNGEELVEINAQGETLRSIGKKLPHEGWTVKTGLDSNLQKFSYQKIKEAVLQAQGKSGVVVIQDVKTGNVITMASYPSYDNNYFTHPEQQKNTGQSFTDAGQPLLNRAIGGAFAPGSTYKMVTALAALQSGQLTADTLIEDTGNITVSGITFNNWYFTQYGKGEGNINIRKALARSNDTFFYKAAMLIGPNSLADMSRQFNYGTVTGIDLIGEVDGLIPTPEWKKKVIKEDWYTGNTINMSIGQGDVLATPLQVNTMTTVLAANGILHKPKLVSKITDAHGNDMCTNSKEAYCKEFIENQKSIKLDIPPHYLKLVQEGMHDVTQRGGTATPFFEFPIPTAGKTGTAETQPNQPPHAWYTAYAPYEKPEISITVLVEKGGEGSKVAAPVAKDIIERYFINSKM